MGMDTTEWDVKCPPPPPPFWPILDLYVKFSNSTPIPSILNNYGSAPGRNCQFSEMRENLYARKYLRLQYINNTVSAVKGFTKVVLSPICSYNGVKFDVSFSARLFDYNLLSHKLINFFYTSLSICPFVYDVSDEGLNRPLYKCTFIYTNRCVFR